MYARASILGIVATVTLGLSAYTASRFTLGTTGAIALSVAGDEARYGVVPPSVNGPPVLVVSLGATSSRAALTLYVPGNGVPAKGRYPIRGAWDENGLEARAFRACLVAGSPERPLGWFHGESGWVTITEAAAGRMSGRFEIQTRGFLKADPENENRWVTVRGTFEADGDSTVTKVAAIGPRGSLLGPR